MPNITDVLNEYNSEHGALRGSSVATALKETLSTINQTVIEAGEELPEVATIDAGKVLKVNAAGHWVVDNDDDNELPTVTSSDQGKVLEVNSSGQWVKSSSRKVDPITIDILYDSTESKYYIDGTPASMGWLADVWTQAINDAHPFSVATRKALPDNSEKLFYSPVRYIELGYDNDLGESTMTIILDLYEDDKMVPHKFYGVDSDNVLWEDTTYKEMSLPDVTIADEGKALVVDSQGEWVAGEVASGNDEFVISLTYNPAMVGYPPAQTLNVSPAELKNAIENNKKIILDIRPVVQPNRRNYCWRIEPAFIEWDSDTDFTIDFVFVKDQASSWSGNQIVEYYISYNSTTTTRLNVRLDYRIATQGQVNSANITRTLEAIYDDSTGKWEIPYFYYYDQDNNSYDTTKPYNIKWDTGSGAPLPDIDGTTNLTNIENPEYCTPVIQATTCLGEYEDETTNESRYKFLFHLYAYYPWNYSGSPTIKHFVLDEQVDQYTLYEV